MSKTQPIKPRMALRASLSFGIVASQYNLSYVQAMVDSAHNELNQLEPGANISLTWVPGSFEIPVAVKVLAAQKKFDALIALGVVFQGETAHATLIAQSVSNALLTVAMDHSIPVIHEVLLLANEEQAKARCLGTELNRGVEAARAAVATARTIREISPKF